MLYIHRCITYDICQCGRIGHGWQRLRPHSQAKRDCFSDTLTNEHLYEFSKHGINQIIDQVRNLKRPNQKSNSSNINQAINQNKQTDNQNNQNAYKIHPIHTNIGGWGGRRPPRPPILLHR